jgi:hypothetical protein
MMILPFLLFFEGGGDGLEQVTDFQMLRADLFAQAARYAFTCLAAGLGQRPVVETGCANIIDAGALLFIA